MYKKAILVSLGLWGGTFFYCAIFRPHTLVVDIIDRCWFEFIGAMAFAFIEEMRKVAKEPKQ